MGLAGGWENKVCVLNVFVFPDRCSALPGCFGAQVSRGSGNSFYRFHHHLASLNMNQNYSLLKEEAERAHRAEIRLDQVVQELRKAQVACQDPLKDGQMQ